MEEQENNEEDIPIEEVNRVINQSNGNKESYVKSNKGYVDLTKQQIQEEMMAKQELDNIVVPEITPSQQPFKVNINLLQFECEKCKFKQYINLQDEELSAFTNKVKCLSCGKGKAIKKRIFDMTINDIEDVVIESEKSILDQINEEASDESVEESN